MKGNVQCIETTYDLFAVNTGRNSEKLKMLVQPKYNSKYGCKNVFGIKVLAYGTE